MSNVGFCYLYGNGIEENEEEAFKYFSKAAIWGVLDATIRLGDMYKYGKYVEKDLKTAHYIYKMALDCAKKDLSDWGKQQAYSDVCKRIADNYYYGTGVSENKEMAFKYYSKALYYYIEREKKGDSYSKSGYEKTKEKLSQLLSEL